MNDLENSRDKLNVSILAQKVFSSADGAIDNGVVTICDGRIAEIKKSKTPSADVVDLGEVALIPGLVNAHTHLEFSDLPCPVGKAGMAFTEWLKLVIQNRMNAVNKSKAIREGVAESIESGVVAIGEIATAPVEQQLYVAKIPATVFLERLTRNSELCPRVADDCESWIQESARYMSSDCSDFQFAVSPHAPYSVHPMLLERLVETSISSQCPMAMHLAETPEELELLANQTGPFVEFLKTIGAWYPGTYSPNETIEDYLKVLSKAPKSLVVHGNYLTDNEINFVASQQTKMSVVYCPRTHAYFKHEQYPLAKLLNAGVNVAIGTDSRASNPDLSLFNELQYVRQRFSDLSDQQILTLGADNGLNALGLTNDVGQIIVGNVAQFNVVKDSADGLFAPQASCVSILDSCFSF